MIDVLLTKWHKSFGSAKPEVIVRAPGRVNIIGEHTDYNEGWVLPGAMNQSIYILVSKSKKKTHHWIASDLKEEYNGEEAPADLPVWAKYIEGTIRIYAHGVGPLHILLGGDLPVGAGLSSSSSVVCGLLFALQKICGKSESREELAMIGSRVEREIIGLQGGIMDQFAIMLSKKDSVMLLDCRTKETKFIPAKIPDAKWILINTKVKHQLIDTNYNERAEECQRAVAIIKHQYPEVKNLRDVTSGILASTHLPPVIARRVRFVLEENARVLDMVKALENKDAKKAGSLLKASHKGLRTDYEVSCDELNHVADFANQFKGVYGARMMGGGFGGCVICLLKEEVIQDFSDECMGSYSERFKYEPDVIQFELKSGVEYL